MSPIRDLSHLSDADQNSLTSSSELTQTRSGEEQFVRYLARWALLVSAVILVFDLAVVRNYPFPSFLGNTVRGLFYTGLSILLLLASVFLAFLGYRIITLKYVGRTKALYGIFLPAVLFATSVFWFIILAR